MKKSEYKKIVNELTVAYKKLKSYIYYDDTLVDLKVKIANFESGGVRKKLINLATSVIEYKNGDTAYIDNMVRSYGPVRGHNTHFNV